MTTAIALAVSALLFAIVFWGSIRLLDGKDPRNKFSLALFFGFVFGFFGLSPGSGILFFIPLGAIFMLLNNYYRLSLWKTMVVMLALIFKDIAWIVLCVSG